MKNIKHRFISISMGIALLLLFLMHPSVSYAASFPIIGTLHAGEHPEGMAVDLHTHLLYIHYEYPSTLVAFDPIQGSVRWRVSFPASTTDVQVDSDSHRVFVTTTSFESGKGSFAILDGANGHMLYQVPILNGDSGIAFDAAIHRIYVSNARASAIFVFDVLTGWTNGPMTVRASRLEVGMTSDGIAVDGQLGKLYVASSQGVGRVAILDEQSGRTITIVHVAAQPLHPLHIDSTLGRVYVVCSAGQELDVIDSHTNTVIARIPSSPNPEGMAFNTATNRLYIANEGDHVQGTTVTVVDGQTLTTLGTLQVGRSPDGVEADPALHRVYIALEDDNAVLELTDSTALALKPDSSTELIFAQQGISLLQQAMLLTFIAMLLTIVGATLGAQLPRWRVRGNPRTRPEDASSRSEPHTLPQ